MCVCLVAFVAVLYLFDSSQSDEERAQAFNAAAGRGASALDFELPTTSGETLRLSQYQGRPVLLSFGATWCPACEEELPTLQRLYEQNPGLAVVLVDSGEKMAVVRSYIAGKRVTFPVAVDGQKAATRRYKVYAFPTLIFIDKAGVIQQSRVGTLSDAEFAEALAAIGIASP